MKTKLVITSLFFLSYIGITNAALSITTESTWDNTVKVQVVSDNTEKVTSVWFTLWYDPTLKVTGLSNWNLMTTWTPTSVGGVVSYSGEGSTSEVGSGVLASFTLERPTGTDITDSLVSLESGSINGKDLVAAELGASKSFSFNKVADTVTPTIVDSTSSDIGSKVVAVSNVNTSVKTGSVETNVILFGLLSLILGTVYLRRTRVI